MINRAVKIVIFVVAFGYFSGICSDLHAQIWELANKTHRSLQIVPAEGKVIFSVSNHLFFSSDLGHSFTVDDGNASNGITGFAIGSTGLFYFSSPHGLFSSPAYNDINNENWILIDSTNLPQITSLFVRAAADAPGNDEIFAGTARGLWHRRSNLNTWEKIHEAEDSTPILQITAFHKNVYYITQSSAFASHDGGLVWKSIAASANNGSKTGIIATSDTDVFLAISGKPGSLVLHSTDGGNSFNGPRGTNFSSETIRTFIANAQGDLYLGGGVRNEIIQDSITKGFSYRLLHDRIYWENFSAGLPSGVASPEVIGMGFGSRGNVFAGTDSAGVWRTFLPSAVRQIAAGNGIIVSQNFPNPTNSTTEFSVFTDHIIKASIDLFDAFGRDLLQISRSELTPGTHFFRVDIKDLPNGTYFYRLQTPQTIASRSLIIAR